jgi:hypothetical protein
MKEVFAANTKGKEKCATFADCKRSSAGKSINYEGASAAFKNMNKFGTFEPNAGVYEVWAFDQSGRDVTARPRPRYESANWFRVLNRRARPTAVRALHDA